jgi:AcrR family transcriptional regulator
MHIPHRILRAEIDDMPGERNRRSARDYAQEDRILGAAQRLISRHGREAVSLTGLADALRMSRTTLRRHFCDIESIVAEILVRHLRAISTALGKIPFDAPNARAARRAAYLAYTRTPFNAPIEAHVLLIRDRHGLPPDLAEPIENIRASIGDLLAGADAAIALNLLDMTELQGKQIETMLASLNQEAAPQLEQPAQKAEPPSEKPRFTPPRLVGPIPLHDEEPPDDLVLLGRHTPPPPPTTYARAGPP